MVDERLTTGPTRVVLCRIKGEHRARRWCPSTQYRPLVRPDQLAAEVVPKMGDQVNWLGIGELSVALIGVVLAIYFYQKTRQKVGISYSVERTQLLGGNRNVLPDEVSILYKDVRIEDLVKFNTIFWNSGNSPIRKSRGHPL
jgi:hypothetical protein